MGHGRTIYRHDSEAGPIDAVDTNDGHQGITGAVLQAKRCVLEMAVVCLPVLDRHIVSDALGELRAESLKARLVDAGEDGLLSDGFGVA